MIKATHLRLKRDAKVIASDFSLEIAPGRIVALVGPNGSGKSTALAAIAGDTSLYSGQVLYEEIDSAQLSIEERARKRSVVSQSQRFALSFTVREVLQMATYVSGNEGDINRAIHALDIHGLVDRKITSLSGGEQQRVSIAMGLAQSTPYLFLDEPFSAQDTDSFSRIRTHLRHLSDGGIGILVVAHMEIEQLSWCDEVVRFPALEM